VRLVVTVAAAALAAAIPGASAPPPPVAPAPPPNLLLVTLDTVRADRLGCYGSKAAGTPVLDRLAREGALVERAVAVAPLTLPAHASILTGLYPPSHGVRDNSDFALPGSATTLAEQMAARGYRTAAVVGAAVLSRSQGLDQGFERYDEPAAAPGSAAGGPTPAFRPILERRAAEVTDRALASLEVLAPGPFFLWVHYFDPHAAYEPPEPFRTRFAGRPYDGEVAYTDAEVGRLLAALEAKGIASRTLTAVVADHGEGLGEHGESTHGVFLYETTLRVPLLLRMPGRIAAGTRFDGPVSQVDLAPTLLELLGLPPLPGAQGTSFAAALTRPPEDPVPARGLYSETLYPERAYGWSPLFALTEGNLKLIEAPRPELYDLAADPGERRNLAAARSEELARRRARLAATSAAFSSADGEALRPADAERREQLAALGYVSRAGRAAGPPRLDPKDGIRHELAIESARAALLAGRPKETLTALAPVLAADPGNAAALNLSGMALFATGERGQGIEHLGRAVASGGEVFEYRRNLGAALLQAGQPAAAIEQFEAALALQPDSADARFALVAARLRLAQQLAAEGKRDAARTEAHRVLDDTSADERMRTEARALLSRLE